MKKLLLTFLLVSQFVAGALGIGVVIGPPGGGGELVEFGQPVNVTGDVLNGAHCVKFRIVDSNGNIVLQTDCYTDPSGTVAFTWTPPFDGTFTIYADSYDALEQLIDSQSVLNVTVAPPPDSQGFITGGGTFSPGPERKTFGFVAKVRPNGSVTGNLEFQDHGMGLNAKSQAITWVYSPNLVEGWFSGTCTINGEAGYSFFAMVHDRGEPGDNDDFAIWIFDGANGLVYSAGDTLSGGNIQIHSPH